MPAAMMIAAMALASAAAWAAGAGSLSARLQTPKEGPAVVLAAPAEEVSVAPTATGNEAAPVEDETTPQPPRVRIEVNIPATEMILFEEDVPLFRRRVAIGSGVYPTPSLTSVVKRIEWNPWWYPPPYAEWAKNDKPTPPGPGNPLGLAKIPLSGDILFHGTNKEWTVGTPASHGCMRMMNRDVTAIAWFLQSRFSEKNDPALRETYRKNRGTTYTVHLDAHIPVELVYRPVVARNGSLFFYPDHYNRLAGRKKAGILSALIRNGFDVSTLDDSKLEELVRKWPQRGTEVDLKGLMIEAPGLSLLDAPACE